MANQNISSFPLFVKLCSDKSAFEVRTKRKLALDMDEVKRRLEESKEHTIIVHTPHIVILRSGGAETTLSRDGRMLVKRVPNEAEATRVAGQILRTVLK